MVVRKGLRVGWLFLCKNCEPLILIGSDYDRRHNCFATLTENGFQDFNQIHTASLITNNPVSPPLEVTLTIGEPDGRTIALQTLSPKRNGSASRTSAASGRCR